MMPKNSMSKESKLYRRNKEILYERHNYDPGTKTKNIHHIIFKSEGGTDEMENLALIDRELHAFIHKLIQNMDNIAKKELLEKLKNDPQFNK